MSAGSSPVSLASITPSAHASPDPSRGMVASTPSTFCKLSPTATLANSLKNRFGQIPVGIEFTLIPKPCPLRPRRLESRKARCNRTLTFILALTGRGDRTGSPGYAKISSQGEGRAATLRDLATSPALIAMMVVSGRIGSAGADW